MNKKILQFHYDSVTGNIDTQTDALGVVTSFKEYDANGRWGKAEFTRTISEGITEIVSTSNIYDNMGRVTEILMEWVEFQKHTTMESVK